MKILYYSSHPSLNLAAPTGYGTHMREMIAAFRQLGHQVKPVIMGGMDLPPTSSSPAAASGWKQRIKSVLPTPVWEGLKDLQLMAFDQTAHAQLKQTCLAFEPDLMYERSAYLQRSGLRVAQQLGIPHILEENAPQVDERQAFFGRSLLSKKARHHERYMLSHSQNVCVVSSALRDHFVDKYKLAADRFLVTPNAIQPEQFQASRAQVAQARQELGLVDKTVIGFVGSIFPWHGVDLVLEAAAALVRDFPQLHVLIVGDGETLPQLKEQAARLGLAGQITFTGNVPHAEVPKLIELIDIAVMARSNWYGSPVKIFEYGLLKKAIVGPDVGPVREVMQHQVDGWLVQPDAEDLLAAFRTLLQDEPLRHSMAEHFHQKVLRSHTWTANAEKVLSVFHTNALTS